MNKCTSLPAIVAAVVLLMSSAPAKCGPLVHGLELTVKAERKAAITAARKARLATIGSLLVAVQLTQYTSYPTSPEILKEKERGAATYSTRICFEGSIKVAVTANFKVCPNGQTPVSGPTIDLSSV